MESFNLDKEYSTRFDELRLNRVKTSFHKYGSVERNYKTGNVKALPTALLCIEKYNSTGNTEYLVDAANYIMFEFMYPQHEKAYFRATSSEESAGQVGLSEGEAKRFKEQHA